MIEIYLHDILPTMINMKEKKTSSIYNIDGS